MSRKRKPTQKNTTNKKPSEYISYIKYFFENSSLIGIIASIAAWYAFPPNLTIDEVQKGYSNIESRLIIKNIGMMPAYDITTDIEKFDFGIGGLGGENNTFSNKKQRIKKLASEEKTQFPICPGFGANIGMPMDICSFNMTLNYELRIFFLFSWSYTKEYYVELRNSSKGFEWHYTMK